MPKGIPTTGKRKPGAGRKSGPEVKVVSFRIPLDLVEEFKQMAKALIKRSKEINLK